MYHKSKELMHIFNTNMKGGAGTVEVIKFINEGDCESSLQLIAKLILKSGCSLGKHQHDGEEEIITILSGTASYNDNGVLVVLNAGDSCICLSGQTHSIANFSETEDLILLAVINKL